MRSRLTGYAGAFNRRHHRAGHLFQNRYKAMVVAAEPYLLEFVRYLHRNPLRAGSVSDLRALDRYPWSGHAPLLGRGAPPWQAIADILGRFGRDLRRARVAYRAFIAAGAAQGRRPELQGGGWVRSRGGWQAVRSRRGRDAPTAADARVLGTGPFVEAVLRAATQQAPAHERRPRRHLDLETLVRRVGDSLGVTPAAITGRTRQRPVVRARQLVACLWVEPLGRPASELARAWGLSRSNTAWAAKRGSAAIRE